jgi:hypothetical protein
MRAEALRTLRAELQADLQLLLKLEEKWQLINQKIKGIQPDEFDYVALAYSIVSLYSVMENYFLRVAKCFENELGPSSWHRDLVRRMSLEIEGIRPAVLDTSDVSIIDELRAFRHVFRHIYQTELDPEKVILVNQRIPEALKRFRSAHVKFIQNLESIIVELGRIPSDP